MSDINVDTDWAFTQYESIRKVLPAAKFPAGSKHIANLSEVADRFDVFLLDAFGVLNVGETPIPGAPEQVAALQAMGKRVMVLTNGASLPAERSMEKYRLFGFDLKRADVISSRDILMASLEKQSPIVWGCMALSTSKLEEFSAQVLALGDDPQLYNDVGGFILLGSAGWTSARQALMVNSLIAIPRPILVGNPDLVAPRETDLSLEPGWFGHHAAHETGISPQFFGKPFDAIFAEARKRVPADIPNDRIAMVGDTLHTDILGGKAAGFGTVLIAEHGLFRGKNVASYIKASGIIPDFIAPTT